MICYILILLCITEYLKKRYIGSMLIFWFLLLEGFQVIPLGVLTFGFFSGTTIDAALICFLLLLVLRVRIWINNWSIAPSVLKAIAFFLVLLVLNTLYGYLNGYSVIDIFRGARLYLFLGSFLMFVEMPLQDILKVMKFLIIITFFQSILFLMQVVTGVSLLQGPEALVMEDDNYIRFYNLPKLLDFALLISLFWFPFDLSRKLRYLFIAVFILTLIAPLHRGYLLAWFLSLIFSSLYFNNYIEKFKYVTLMAVVAGVVLSIELVRNRLYEAMVQFSVLTEVFSGNVIYESNTFIYRINHLMERIDLVNLRALGWLFGIGLIDDHAPQAANLPLNYGLPDPITGNIIKVYTPDLVWSMLILTMGYIGAILYLNIFGNILYSYAKIVAEVKLKKVLFTLILIAILTSFTGNFLLQPHFFLPCLMLLVIISKYDEQALTDN
jgi:hypothetical protein